MVNIGHGFKSGVNNITITKVEKWLNKKITNWYAFLWYISNYVTIVDYGSNWVKVKLLSEKQRSFFYKKAIEYNEVEEYNFEVDKTNELWRTHKRNIENNKEIYEKLINEKVRSI